MTESVVAAHSPTTRRALLGAGVIGAALAAAVARPAQAAAGLSDGDVALATFAIGAELAARDLYAATLAGGGTDQLWSLIGEQHSSYADRIAGIAGISADTRAEALYAERVGEFTGDTPLNAAFRLENLLAATHTDLLATVADADLADALASIVAIESRHSTYLATRTGRDDDFDALLSNDATALSPETAS